MQRIGIIINISLERPNRHPERPNRHPSSTKAPGSPLGVTEAQAHDELDSPPGAAALAEAS